MNRISALDVLYRVGSLPVRFLDLLATSPEELKHLQKALTEAGWTVEAKEETLTIRARRIQSSSP